MISAQAKKLFFDRAPVIEALGRAKAARLSKAGAFIRTAARSSMRRRKAPSAPGSPPSTHSRSSYATLRNIWFAWDRTTESMVVGSVALNMLSKAAGFFVRGTVPAVEEFGGTVGIFEYQNRSGEWSRVDLRSRRRAAGRPTRTRNATYKPRPYMKPAMEKELPKFPELFKNSVLAGM